MEMMKKSIFFITLSILVLLIFFLSFFFICLFLLFPIEKNEEMKDNNNIIEKYQYFEKDYLRNESSFGIVSLFEKIDQFVSYDDYELQKSVLISSFGTEEFECFGSCYCEKYDDNFRRISHSQVLIERVSYLLAAISSVVAFNIAKDYFAEKCSENYSNICESKSIKSEVNNCEKIVSDNNISFEERERGERRVYFCYGNCLDNLHFGSLSTSQIRPTAKEEGIDCKKLKQEGETIVYSNELIVKSSLMNLSQRMRQTARYKFQEYHLVPFCKENSKIEYEYQQPNYYFLKSGEKKKSFETVKKSGYMCVGNRSKSRESRLKYVRCRQIEPESTSPNASWRDKVWWKEKEEWDKN